MKILKQGIKWVLTKYRVVLYNDPNGYLCNTTTTPKEEIFMDNLLNIKSNWKHSTFEYLIKKVDSSQDMSRSAVFEREVKAARGVDNWKAIQTTLSDLKKEEEAPIFTSFQAKYDDETAEILEGVKKDILTQLEGSLKVLQTQYMVQLLQANYLETLKREKVALKADEFVEETDVDLPEMSKIFTEMMLKDKDCSELKQIRKILVDWRNA